MSPPHGPLRQRLNQWKHPREFRVPRPRLDAEQASWVTELLTEAEAAEAQAVQALKAEVAAAREEGHSDPEALLGAATGVWRTLRKLDQRGEQLSAADLRQIRRYLSSGQQALAEGGLEIQNHDGLPFDSGQSLEVLLFQEDPALTREVVLETVRPSVYFQGRRIQMGQVVVGRPGAGDG